MTFTAIIDGDIIAHKSAAKVHEVYDLGDGVVGTRTDALRAAEVAIETVSAWTKLAGCSDAIVCFSGRQNFRKLILPSYKAHRVKGKPPDFYSTVEAIEGAFKCHLIEGLEADDVMGLLATSPNHTDRIVVTIDKDLQTVPGLHFNPDKDSGMRDIEPAEADYYWMQQTLTGDSTDGYKGIPGVGPSKAARILGEPGECDLQGLWARVVSAYSASNLTEQDALVQCRVARILRHGEFDHKNQVVTLWHPTHPPKMALRFPHTVGA